MPELFPGSQVDCSRLSSLGELGFNFFKDQGTEGDKELIFFKDQGTEGDNEFDLRVHVT